MNVEGELRMKPSKIYSIDLIAIVIITASQVSFGMAQYKFVADGRYEYGQGTSTTFATRETRTGSVADGRWELRGGELIITGGRGTAKFRVRIYAELSGRIWLRTLSLINESSNPPLSLSYMRVEN